MPCFFVYKIPQKYLFLILLNIFQLFFFEVNEKLQENDSLDSILMPCYENVALIITELQENWYSEKK